MIEINQPFMDDEGLITISVDGKETGVEISMTIGGEWMVRKYGEPLTGFFRDRAAAIKAAIAAVSA